MRAALLPLALAAALVGFAKPPQLPDPYRALAELARAAPPEFAADALLRIAESGRLKDPASKTALLAEAFQLAAVAHFEFPMRGVELSDVDSPSGSLRQAYRLRLDALSLQARAVRDLLPLHPAQARELFARILKPSPAPPACRDALVFDAPDFYETLGLVARETFTPAEKAREDDVNFLLSYFAPLTSPAQVPALAHAIEIAGLAPAQQEAVAVRFRAIANAFESPAPCRSGPEIAGYWKSPAARRIFEQARALRFSSDGTPLSGAVRAAPEWDLKLADFMKEFGGWQADGDEPERDFYYRKCLVYQALLDTAPPSPAREKLLDEFAGFMARSGLERRSPAEWFVPAARLLESARNSSPAEAARAVEAFRSSASPSLALAAALETVFGSGVPAWAKIAPGTPSK